MSTDGKYTERLLSLNMNSSLDERRLTFDEVAPNWDKISENVGYKGHFLCVEAFDRAVSSADVYPNPPKDIKILDVGAGTGGVGEMLKARGYTNVDATDISQEMLNLAASKNLYKKLICAPLSDTHMEEIDTAEYDVVLCAGVIAYGQTLPGAIEQCARFLKPGGLFIFTVRCETYDPEGHNYEATSKKLEEAGKWKLIFKEKREQHSTPNEERFRYSYVITYKILQ